MFGQTIDNHALLWQEDLAIPQPQPHEVLIKVAYAGVNRADIFQKQGRYPAPAGASPLPGLEVSGHIAVVGSEVRGWKEGDAVCALLEGGGYAEYATVGAGQLLPVPKGWTLREAGVLPEALFTCWLALVEVAALKQGEAVLIHGGASGIGSFAIQLARCLGAEVIATAGTPEKTLFCQQLGAKQVINYKNQNFANEIPEKSIAVVLDMVGGDYMSANLGLLQRGGRIVQLAFLRGAKAEVNLAPLLINNLTWKGITLRSQTRERKANLAQAIQDHSWLWLEQKRLFPVIDSEFSLREAEKAHQRMEQNLNLGKIVLKVTPS